MSGNGNQVPLAPSQRGPGQYPRAPTPLRPECYHPGAAGGAYMSAGGPGPQGGGQPAMRVQQNQPPPSAPPQQPQDLNKNAMSAHNYVPGQNQPQPRAQYPTFPYTHRTSPHAPRPGVHPRQQGPYMQAGGGGASGTAPVMYPVVFPPTMLPQYQQPRAAQGFYPFIPYIGYTGTPPNQSFYYSTGGQQLPTPNLSAAGPGARSAANPVGLQAPSTPAPPAAAMPHPPQQPTHMQPMQPNYHPSMRPAPTKRSHRIPIIDPKTRQEVLSEIYSNDSQYVSGDSSERQTPQPQENAISIAEEFNRMVNEAVNQPSDITNKSNYTSTKNADPPVTVSSASVQPQTSAIHSINNNNNIVKSDLCNVNENKPQGPDVAVESNETPVVSAISLCPDIVPKIQNVKQYQNISNEPLVIDNNRNTQPKLQKQNSKPFVPEEEVKPVEVEPTPVDSLNAAPPLQQRVRPQRVNASEELITNGPDTAVSPQTDNKPADTDTTTADIDSPLDKSDIDSGLDKSDTSIEPPTPTQMLAASIEKVAKEIEPSTNIEDAPCVVIEAQAKLTQNIVGCLKTKEPNETVAAAVTTETANGENVTTTPIVDAILEEKVMKNTRHSNKKAMSKANTDVSETESMENGKDETDKLNVEQSSVEPLEQVQVKVEVTPEEGDCTAAPDAAGGEPAEPIPPAVPQPKYKYSDDQWSPFNTSGKKHYDINLLKQIKEDPVCKIKPEAPLLEACKVMRSMPMQDPLPFTHISRPLNDALLPSFAKSLGLSRSTMRDPKKDGRSLATNIMGIGKGSVKLIAAIPPMQHKPVIHVSLSLREDVKLNEIENAWKPTRLKKEDVTEDEFKTETMYKKFRGILNKLTPQKFDTLIEKVKNLEINNQKRLEGVIDLVFEKAIDEPNFSEAYAAMCNKLSKLKVPADNATSPEQYVNFRALIISRCQNQFVTDKVDESVLKIEKELADCTDPAKKRELTLMLAEENRKIRMRSVGNVRFIGELYKLKMLTSKIMLYCITYLLDKVEEEKLECLCKLLTTIGEQIEGEKKSDLDNVFKKMQDIVDRKSNKISSRVRFMIQDVIELRRRRWVGKSVIDSQPKMMDQIKNEAEQHQRHIELMNSSPMGGYRRDDGGGGGGRNKRGDSRRQNSNTFVESSNWKSSRSNYQFDVSKLKAATNKNLSNIKLAPHNSAWNHGSGTKMTAQSASSSIIGLTTTTNNMYSVLAESVSTDPSTIRAGSKEVPQSSYHSKGASIERSTFNPRGDYSSSSGSRSGSMEVPSSSASVVLPSGGNTTTPETKPTVPQEQLPDAKKKSVKSTVDLCLINRDNDEMVADVRLLFPPQYHAAFITEFFNVAFEKSAKDIELMTKSLRHIVSTNTISADNLIAGISEIFEFAPDLYIDIPMLYDYLGKFLAPHIETKHITFEQVLRISENIVSSNHGHLFLRSVIKELRDSMGPSFAKNKWQESALELTNWMSRDQVAKFIEDNKFEFLEGGAKASDDNKKILSPAETQTKLLQLMHSDENCECIRGWVQDNLGKSSNEDWFMRSLIQAISEYSLFGPKNRDMPHFSKDRMFRYIGLINDFGESKLARESNCLVGIQQLIHRLEHPQGVTLEIFQFLNDQYIITVDGFIAWEQSKAEPEGKAVMMKALTSFFTSIQEADNEDSCSED